MAGKGFSLMELTVVLLILAIAAAAVALGLCGPFRRAEMADVIGQIAAFDGLTRAYAYENDRPVRLVIDPSSGRLFRNESQTPSPVGTPLELPDGYAVTRVRVRDVDVRDGTAAIQCSRAGMTPSYALRVEGPGGRREWILIAGLTGQVVQGKDEDEIRDILAAVGTGPDAR